MRAGQLRHTVTVTQPVVSGQNAAGEDIVTWSDVGTYKANLAALQGRELATAAQRWADARYMLTMRRQPGITFTRKMRVQWLTRVMDILDVQDMGESFRPFVTMYLRDYDG